MEPTMYQIGGSMYECKPLLVFSGDKKVILCAMGTCIKILSETTGELVGTYSRHSTLITCIALGNDPLASGHTTIITSSIDGSVSVWNLDSLDTINQFSLPLSILDIIVPAAARYGKFLTGIDSDVSHLDIQDQRAREELYLVCCNKPGDATASAGIRMVAFDTAQFKIRRKVTTMNHARGCSGMLEIKQKDRKEEVLLIADQKNLLVWSVASKSVIGTLKSDADASNITCLSVCNQRGMVVTGHDYGMLCFWHNVNALILAMITNKLDTQRAQCTVHHWHSHGVASIAVSPDGVNVYSGGEEGVLVLWQIDTGYKSFVPRLGAAITQISSSLVDASVVVTTADNTIRIINAASLREEWAVKHVSVARSISRQLKGTTSESQLLAKATLSVETYIQADAHYKCLVGVESRTGFLACNGYPGELQMMDMSPVVQYTHHVVPYTRISKKETSTKMYVPSISIFQFYSHAITGNHYLATVDVTRGKDTAPETTLKFWIWSHARNKYRLSATVERPHGSARVTGIDFMLTSSESTMKQQGVSCATTSSDGSVKVWKGVPATVTTSLGETQIQHDTNTDNSASMALQWSCAYSFRYRESPSCCIQFSRDGSVLAVGHANMLTLWDPTSLSLKGSFLSNAGSFVTFAKFIEPCASAIAGGGCGLCYLVVGSDLDLQVFDLLTTELVWSVRGDFTAFAVASSEATVFTCVDDKIDSKSKSTLAKDGWIAAASRITNTAEQSIDKQYKIDVFSPISAKPLFTSYPSAAICSAAFVANPNTPNHGMLATVSTSGVLAALSSSGFDATNKKFSAKISGKSVPALNIQSADVFGQKDALAQLGLPSNSFDGTESFSLAEVASNYMPTVAELYGSFMGSVLKKPSKAKAAPNASLSSINAASAVISEEPRVRDRFGNATNISMKSKPVERASETAALAGSTMSAEERQAIFDASLLSIFESANNITTAIPVAVPNGKVAGSKRRSNSVVSEDASDLNVAPVAKRTARQSKQVQ